MFQRPTVFILGAGSSNEVNLPVGAELRTAISRLLHTVENDIGQVRVEDHEVFQAIRNAQREGGTSLARFIEAAQRLAAAMPLALSIDSYLEAHQNDDAKILVGKLAITKAILDAEAVSLLGTPEDGDDRINFPNVVNTWFARFVQAAMDGVPREDLDNIFADVSIINFNYDRCIEHFVRQALKLYYDLDDAEAERIANTLYVFHPYGSVGKLPWQTGAGAGGVRFGSRKRGERLLRIARSIKTFSERVDEGTELHEMKVRVANAEQLIFLGFAFHQQNLQLLGPGYPSEPKAVYATALKISKSDQNVIKNQLPEYLQLGPNDIRIGMEQAKCAQLFDEYWRTFVSYAL